MLEEEESVNAIRQLTEQFDEVSSTAKDWVLWILSIPSHIETIVAIFFLFIRPATNTHS